jgi:hypothetical protein
MPVFQTGLKKLEIGDFNNGTPNNFVELKVHRDTMTIDKPDATENKFYQAGQSSPVLITTQEAGGLMASFDILDTSADTMLMLCGGTVTTVNNVKTWNSPVGNRSPIIKAIRATTLQGGLIVINRGALIAKESFSLAENNIAVIKVKVEALDTGTALAATQFTDPV